MIKVLSPEPSSISPLSTAFEQQVVPWVRQYGMKNVVIAAPSRKKFLQSNITLPDGVIMTPRLLKSRRKPNNTAVQNGKFSAYIDATWPADGLFSTTFPVLMFVLSGQVALPLGDYLVHLKAGHAVLMPAGTPRPAGTLAHATNIKLGGYDNDMLSIIPWNEGVECWINHTKDSKHWSHLALGESCHILSAVANDYLRVLADEAAEKAPYSALICDGLLLTLTALLMREINASRIIMPGVMTSHPGVSLPLSQDHNFIERAQKYVDNHLGESLTIDRMAARLFVSRAYFTRQFRKITGKTFIQYVNERRLEASKVLLQETDWSIARISTFVGITPARLRQLLQDAAGQTPSEYRQQSRPSKK